jgi:hypothetical protein
MLKPNLRYPTPWSKEDRLQPISSRRCRACGYFSPTPELVDGICLACRTASESDPPEPAKDTPDDA